MPVFSVDLEANLSNFSNRLNTAVSQAGNVESAMSSLTTNISRNVAAINNTNLNRFNASLQAGTLSVTQFSNTVITPTGNLQSLTRGSNQAAFALTNLGRVAQDAPFGFIGIQNNLNPLLESFQRLRAETGSNGAALRALGQSFIGPAGIGVALSVVSSAILFYQQYQQKAKKATEEGSKSNEEYKKSLDAITKATGENLARLSVLYEASQDVNRPLSERKRIVDALQSQYPSYFGNLKDEAILAGKAAVAYENLQKQLINTAIVKASEGLLAGKFKELAELGLSLAKSEQKLRSSGLNDAQSKSQNNVIVDESGDLKSVRDYRKKITDEIKETQSVLTGLFSDFSVDALLESFTDGTKKTPKAKKIKGIADITKELSIALQQADLEFGKTFDEKNSTKIEAYTKAINDLIKLGYKPASDAVKELIADQQRLFQLPQIAPTPSIAGASGNLFDSKGRNYVKDGKPVDVKIDQTPGEDLFKKAQKNITVAQKKIRDATVDFNKELNSIISAGLVTAFSGVGTAIGTALAEGTNVVDALGSTLLGALGGVLTQLGEMSIGVGIGLIGIKAALESLNPVLAIAGGVALLALGAYVTSKSKAISGTIKGGSSSGSGGVTAFANGGIVSGPTLGLMGEYAGAKSNPEVIAPLDRLKSLIGDQGGAMRQEIVIDGQKLKIVLDRVNRNR